MCEQHCLGSFAETEVWKVEPFQSSIRSSSWLYYKGKRCQFLVELHNLKEENLVLRQARVVLWFNNTGKNSLWMHRLPPASVTLELSRIPGAPFFFLFLSSLSHTILMATQLWCIWIWSIFQRWEMPSFPPPSMCHKSHQGKVALMNIRFMCLGFKYFIKAFLVQTTGFAWRDQPPEQILLFQSWQGMERVLGTVLPLSHSACDN